MKTQPTNDTILNSTMAQIASRVSQLTGEGALAVFARAKELEKQGRSIIHLELGEPDFHPAAPVVDALRSAVAAGRDRYVSTRGIPALREAVADYLKRTRSVQAAPEEVLIAPGCKMALSLAMMALIEPGDEVLYPDPGFPIYPSFVRGLGAKPVPFFLEEKNHFQPDLAEITAKISPRTKVLIFNSPNNPTGTVFSEAALSQIALLAAKHDLWVIADEIYARILFVGGLNRIAGFRCQPPQGAFYAWVNIEDTGLSAQDLASTLLEEAGVAAIAGAAFGAAGKNYLRFSLVSARNLLEEALERIERVSARWRGVVAARTL